MFKHVPNILSAFRILLVPVFAFVYFSNIEGAHNFALAIFIVANVTDVIDGYLARKFDLITKVGTVLDPLADKLMQLTVLICLTLDGFIPLWLTLAILGLDLGMIIAGSYMYFREHSTVIPSNNFGKSATILFALAMFISILFPDSLASFIFVISALSLKLLALSTYMHNYYTKIKPKLPIKTSKLQK